MIVGRNTNMTIVAKRSFYTWHTPKDTPRVSLDDGSVFISRQKKANPVIAAAATAVLASTGSKKAALDAVLPPRLRTYPARSPMSREQEAECKKLRLENPDVWTVQALTRKYDTYPGRILALTADSMRGSARKRMLQDQEKAQFDALPIKVFMRAALEQAQEASDAGEVPVGCVIVLESSSDGDKGDGRIIARGRNRTNESLNGTRHAEMEAIDDVVGDLRLGAGVLGRCALYVTIEPCVMCAAALRHAGLAHVVFGSRNDRFGGCGSVLNAHTSLSLHSSFVGGLPVCRPNPVYSIEHGLFKDEAIIMLRRFYLRENENAPNPKKKNNRNLKISK
ncbi:tRNA(adenine34) deaminase [Physocladia obscura]|uniref:tRNA(Adenine34) deaminase n=1 Tax=Physocladia obscura TaxID=109957 RepID=A0AAD5XHY7_9FUNG|nr:tRNA(adenine34) deaminase [Physocladia obscura]